jgi:hypothetical protein
LSDEYAHLLWIQDIIERIQSPDITKPDGVDLEIYTSEFALFNAKEKREIFLLLLGRVVNAHNNPIEDFNDV